MIGEDEEDVVKTTKGYGTVVEIILKDDDMETAIRLNPSGAIALGKALVYAGVAAQQS